MVLKLYMDLMSQPCRAVLFFCRANQIPHEVVVTNLTKRENKAPAILALNPNGLLPIMVDDDFVLYESHAIMKYLRATRPCADHWYPAGSDRLSVETRARMDQWLDWHHLNLRVAAASLFRAVFMMPKMGIHTSPKELEKLKKHLIKVFKALDDHLSKTGTGFMVSKNASLVKQLQLTVLNMGSCFTTDANSKMIENK
eukprot:656391_1